MQVIFLDSAASRKWIIASLHRLMHWKVRFQILYDLGVPLTFATKFHFVTIFQIKKLERNKF